jgi:hypothetical protein
MGLDISAFSKVVYLGPAEQFSEEQREELYESGNATRVTAATGFEERLDGRPEGFYRVAGEAMGFRAGSYSGYNWWRRHLCLMALGVDPEDVWADPEWYKGKPFVELINFSDCEGCIGPETSRKLAKDFLDHAAKAEAYARARSPGNLNRGADDEDVVHPWWLESYRDWRAVFELARDEGFVDFG